MPIESRNHEWWLLATGMLWIGSGVSPSYGVILPKWIFLGFLGGGIAALST